MEKYGISNDGGDTETQGDGRLIDSLLETLDEVGTEETLVRWRAGGIRHWKREGKEKHKDVVYNKDEGGGGFHLVKYHSQFTS